MVEDGAISMQIKERYEASKNKPDLTVRGEFGINSLFIYDTLRNSLLFSLNKLDMKGFTFEMNPDRFFVDEIDVDSFFVDASIDKNKTLNFSKLLKQTTSKSDIDTQENNETNTTRQPFDAKIVKVVVKNGSAMFADHSIPIDFQTNIHDLNGIIYILSTTPGETTYVNIDGEVDKYGSTKLKGSFDSAKPQLYTDMAFHFKNLDLSSLSGYSASFAGYKIDGGKLYLDLGYNIINAQLDAKNNVMIKKIKLGDAIKDENVTHLPLGLVIGLLEDNEGIIDIDLPIKGDVNQPDFKYGTLVLKTIGNLIAKAVTSPFALLGSMMGLDGDELSYIAFEPGEARILPPEREKLDKLAKLMQKRPKIKLEVFGVYENNSDSYALKKAKLVAEVVKRTGAKNIQDGENAITIELLEEIYHDLQDDATLSDLQEKLKERYKEDQAGYENNYREALAQLVIKNQAIEKDALQKLAKKRQQAVLDYLVQERTVDKTRLIPAKLTNSDTLTKDGLIQNNLGVKVQ